VKGEVRSKWSLGACRDRANILIEDVGDNIPPITVFESSPSPFLQYMGDLSEEGLTEEDEETREMVVGVVMENELP
jgi:hypothetical protein